MATRNTWTSVRRMISGPWAFCESIIYREKYRAIFRESFAKEGLPLKARRPKLWTCYV